MSKITIGDPTKFRTPGRAQAGVPRGRRVRDEQGELVTIYSLDANNENVGDEVLTVFKRNVARVRRAHRELVKKLGVAAE